MERSGDCPGARTRGPLWLDHGGGCSGAPAWPDIAIKARFGSTVCRLVAEGPGLAIIDGSTLAHGVVPAIKPLEIEAPATFDTWVACRSDGALSAHAADRGRSPGRRRDKAVA